MNTLSAQDKKKALKIAQYIDKKELFVVDSFLEVDDKLGVLDKKMDSFIEENDSTIDGIKESIEKLSSDISDECESIFERSTKESNSVISEVEEKIEVQNRVVDDKLSSLGLQLNSSIKNLAKELRDEMPEIPDAIEIDQEAIIGSASRRALETIKPLIPSVETSSSIRDKFDLSLTTRKIDAKFISNLEENIDGSKIKNLPLLGERIIERGVGGFIETPIKAGSNMVVTKDASGAWVITSTASGSSGFQAFTVTRTGSYISSILVGSTTYTISRTGSYISSVTDGSQTLTFTRNGSNQITSGAVS